MTDIRRLRKLAGILNESIADDPYTNEEIERRLAQFPESGRPIVRDALEIVKNAGRPLLPNEWVRQLQSLYPTLNPDDLREMTSTIPTLFNNLVRRNGGSVQWIKAHDMEDDPGVDDMTRSAVDTQVRMLYMAKEIAREPFNVVTLGQELSRRTGVPSPVTTLLAQNFVDQFRSMLEPVGNGMYRMVDEKPTTTDDSMSLLRSLANNPRRDV